MHMKNMKKILIPLFGALLAALPATAPAAAPAASVPVTVLDAGPQSSWRVFIGQDGAIESYESLRHGVWQRVPFRDDIKAGPAWEGVTLSQPTPGVARYTAEQDGIRYSLSYEAAEDHLVVKARLENSSQKEFAPLRSRLHLGIDSDMKSYPEWNDKFFPTLMRCEKSHFWGYFMSPESRIMAVCTSDPVASYGINYIYEEILKWKWGHQIFTGSLDLLHAEPLPARHPHDLGALAPGQSREWTIHMGEIDGLEQLKPTLAAWGDVPMVECDRYTLLDGESTEIQLFGEGADRARISVAGPDGAAEPLEGRTFKPSKGPGEYILTITAPNGKQAEARVYVRNNWSWYQRHARDFVAKYPPFMSGAESIYGYYVAFRAGRHFPDPEKSEPLIERFDKMLDKAWDTVAWKCRTEFMPYRIQNHTTMIGILIDLWRLTGEENYLRQASHIGDYICSDAVQSPDGAYRSNKIHYTAVIYPAKSMLELASAEREAADATGSAWWDEAARRHGISASRACADLLLRRDDIETEGDMTFEDGMVSCAALQLALYALTQDDPAQRAAYTAAAEYIYQKHRCLQQSQIPDARMRGATLRYWEILDIYFAPNQVMNSPPRVDQLENLRLVLPLPAHRPGALPARDNGHAGSQRPGHQHRRAPALGIHSRPVCPRERLRGGSRTPDRRHPDRLDRRRAVPRHDHPVAPPGGRRHRGLQVQHEGRTGRLHGLRDLQGDGGVRPAAGLRHRPRGRLGGRMELLGAPPRQPSRGDARRGVHHRAARQRHHGGRGEDPPRRTQVRNPRRGHAVDRRKTRLRAAEDLTRREAAASAPR